MAIRTMEELIYGPNGNRAEGAISKIESCLSVARSQNIKQIEVECRKTPEGVSSSAQEWVARFPTDKSPEDVAAALVQKLQGSPSDDFRGILRLNFREAGRTSNTFESIERKIESGAPVAVPTGATVPIEVLIAVIKESQEQNRRTLSAATQVLEKGVLVIGGAATLVQAIGDQARGTQETAQGRGGAAEILGKTLGVLATGVTQGPEAGARAAASAVASGLTSPPLEKPGAAPSSASSDQAPAWTEADAEAWAKANPEAAKRLGLKLWNGGL